MKRILPFLLILGFVAMAHGQIEIKEEPYTFENNGVKKMDMGKRLVLSPGKSIAAALIEDEIERKNGLPPRFGLKIETDLNMENSGTWEDLADGSRLWRLQIKSPGAKSINLIYDAFHLPPGGRFHIYNSKRSHVIGAFTELNNKGTLESPGEFATGLVYGDEIILEYHHPANAVFGAVLSVKGIIHGYKHIRLLDAFEEHGSEEIGYGDSGPCQVNVNCAEGNNWQDENKTVQ